MSIRKNIKKQYYRLLQNKQSLPDEIDELYLDCDGVQVSCSTTNIIWRIKHGDHNVYFRECVQGQPLETFVRQNIARFFWACRNDCFYGEEKYLTLHHEQTLIDEFEAYVSQCVTDGFCKKFYQLESVWRAHGGTTYIKGTSFSACEYAQLGFDNYSGQYEAIFDLFFSYFMKAFSAYSLVSGSHKANCISANSFFATYLLAKDFGIDSIISEPYWMRVHVPFAGAMVGFACEEITDGEFGGYSYRTVTASLQHALANLNLFDVVCNHYDHGPNNYFIILKDQEAVSIRCFDNEGSSFRCTGQAKYSASWNCSTIIDNAGMIRRPYLDKALVTHILNIKYARLHYVCRQYLHIWQTIFVYLRILSLRKALKKTLKARPGLAIADDQWSDKTVQEELSGDWGRTYTWIYQNIINE